MLQRWGGLEGEEAQKAVFAMALPTVRQSDEEAAEKRNDGMTSGMIICITHSAFYKGQCEIWSRDIP